MPTVPTRDLPGLYTDYDWNPCRTHRPIAYVEPTISDSGVMAMFIPWDLFTDEPWAMGNVYETPFLDISFGERFQAFRRMLASQGGLLPDPPTAAASSRKCSPKETPPEESRMPQGSRAVRWVGGVRQRPA